jgi:DNA-binding PadR family transcriptional regulator
MRRCWRFGCKRHGEHFGPCSCSLGKISRLVEPLVLYLLCKRAPVHGYQLLQELEDFVLTDSAIDAGAVYRTLCSLEEQGYVTSRWEPGPAGPDRRVYYVTPQGRQLLQDWATALSRWGARIADFVQACRALEHQDSQESQDSQGSQDS